MSYSCKNLLIRCMDFRLRDELMRWINQNELFEGGFDVISVGGSSKDLASGNEEVRDYFLKQIGFSTDLHSVERVIVFHHSDCGAYGVAYTFASKEEEKAKQLEDMNKTKEILNNKYPDVEVVLVWGDMLNIEGKEINFEIIK